ncbi:MAG: 50S ribosomal protein L18 [Candidatus Magasanikiibacteriota bacterium]
MVKRLKTKSDRRQRRQQRVRTRVSGTADCPRFNVFKGLVNFYAQLIDDISGKTLVAVHSKSVDTKQDVGERKGKTAVAYLVGKSLGAKAKEAGVTKVVFDRAGYKYQGRVQAVADGAREAGLKF